MTNFEDFKVDSLIEAAIKAKSNSFCKHSKFRVGSALLTDNGNIYTGTNVEFDAYSLTVCAERASLFNAVSNGEINYKTIAISTDMEDFKYPCGLCRQALIEFAPDLKIILINKSKDIKTILLKDLLPNHFILNK